MVVVRWKNTHYSLSEITNFLHGLKFIYQIQKLKAGVNPLYQQRKEKYIWQFNWCFRTQVTLNMDLIWIICPPPLLLNTTVSRFDLERIPMHTL